MSVSKAWIKKEENRLAVLSMYRSRDIPTAEVIAQSLGTTVHNVRWVLRSVMPRKEYKALARVRYSASKMGGKNPMLGKTLDAHPRWKGERPDGHGYLTIVCQGKRRFVHRVVMAQALGLPEIPKELDVHHIDGDKTNNALDNLAIVTRAGHEAIHFLQARDSKSLRLKRSAIAEALKYMT